MNHSLSIEQIAGRHVILCGGDIQITITFHADSGTIIVRADSTNPAQIIRSRGATDIRNQVEYTLQEAPAPQD